MVIIGFIAFVILCVTGLLAAAVEHSAGNHLVSDMRQWDTQHQA